MKQFLRSLVVGCVGALCAASIDDARGFVAPGSRFASPAFATTTVALTSLLALAVFVVVRWVIVPPFARRAGDRHALSVATAMGVTTFFVVYDVEARHTGIALWFDYLLYVTVAVSTGIGSFALCENDARRSDTTLARLVGRTLPIAMPLALIAAWMGFVYVDDLTSVSFALVMIGLAGAVAATMRVARSLVPTRWAFGVIGIYALVVVLGVTSMMVISERGLPAVGREAKANGKIRQVIMLTVDTLRRDSVSCYGSTSVATPNIDRIAADGCVFRNDTSSSSWTEPSFSSMMTGLSTAAHRVIKAETVLPDTIVTLAERFHAAGYATYAAVANGMLAPHRGFAQGFDRFDIRATHRQPVCIGEVLAHRFERKPVEDETSTRDVTDLAIEWSKARKDRDFFLWVHYYDPHLPYRPPVRFVEHMNIHDTLGYSLDITSLARPTMDLFGTPEKRVWARSLYDADVRYVDSEIGRFLDSLKDSGIYDNALIVFAVDHGEEFWDHDGFEHGHTLYQELVGVPLIFKAPGSHKKRVIDDAVSGCDVTPTVLDLCGLPPVDAPTAVSLSGLIAGTAPHLAGRAIFSGGTLFRSNWESVVFDGFKFIRSSTTGGEQLFRLTDDPMERHTLVYEMPDVAARGRVLLDDHNAAMEAFREEHGISNPTVKLDAEEMERLRTLGYL